MRERRQNIIESFRSAFRGLGYSLKERNFLIQFMIGVVAVAASFSLGFTENQKLIVFVVVALVLGAEMVNSAVEKLLDHLVPRKSRQVAEIKEILAGAVLLFAILSVIVGLILFGPALLNFR